MLNRLMAKKHPPFRSASWNVISDQRVNVMGSAKPMDDWEFGVIAMKSDGVER